MGFRLSPISIHRINKHGIAAGKLNKDIYIYDTNSGNYFDLLQHFNTKDDKEFALDVVHTVYITDDNQVYFGNYNNSNDVWRIFHYDLNSNIATIISNDNDRMFLQNVNANGQMIGQYYADNVWFFDPQVGLQKLPLPENYTYGFIGDLLSSNGYLLGYISETPYEGETKGFLWHSDTGMRLIEGTSYRYSNFSGVNDKGEVIGTINHLDKRGYAVEESVLIHPDQGITKLKFAPNSINNLSQVVGFITKRDDERAVIWDEEKGMKDLNKLIPKNSGWILEEAQKINDDGYIVGRGAYLDTHHHFLLIPRHNHKF